MLRVLRRGISWTALPDPSVARYDGKIKRVFGMVREVVNVTYATYVPLENKA